MGKRLTKNIDIMARIAEICTMPKRSVAKTLHDEFPQYFKDVEKARDFIRYITGNKGGELYEKAKRNGSLISDTFGKFEIEEPECPKESFKIPTGIERMLIINDLHFLFMDMQAAEASINYAVSVGCDAVHLNGDIMDNYQLSKFDKDANKAKFHKERDGVKDFLSMLQNLFGNVYYKQGNHENRYEVYLKKNAPAIFSADENNLQSILEFEGSRVQFIDESQITEFGKLAIIHGHEIKGGGSVNIARNKMLKAYTNIAFGHHHTVQQSPMKDLHGNYFMAFSIGCLCDLKPRYMPFNQWMHGFATVERLDEAGNFHFDNKMIIKGKVI